MRQQKMRDLRHKEKFSIDDEYINTYAKVCGWQATLVYTSLCRHADKDQYSFPSIKLMAEQHGVGRNTIIKGIQTLEEWRIIEVTKKARTKQGIWRNNGYTLLDKIEWKRCGQEQPCPPQGHGTRSSSQTPPGPPGKPDQVLLANTKDTHKKEAHEKDPPNPPGGHERGEDRKVRYVLGQLTRVDPKNKMYYGHKAQRKACVFLVNEYGEKEIENALDFYQFARQKRIKYRPKITTPIQLMEKWSDLIDLIEREQAKKQEERANYVP